METKRQKRVQMPIGYRFCPTDEEIIIHYLRPKVLSFPLPAPAIIHSLSLSLSHPHHLHPATLPLPGDPKEKRYFFCKTSFHHPHPHPHAASGGYWKPIMKKLILATGCNHPIGFKKSFVFYHYNPTPSRTPWLLHQFRLLYSIPLKMEEEWVACSLQFKSKKPITQPYYHHRSRPHHEEERLMPVLVDHHYSTTISDIATQRAASTSTSTSTSSSGITFNDDMDEQEAVVS